MVYRRPGVGVVWKGMSGFWFSALRVGIDLRYTRVHLLWRNALDRANELHERLTEYELNG